MALVNIKTGKGRQKFVEFVVVGDEDKGCKLGDIRWVWWDRSKSSPMLKVEWTSKERIHVKEIRLHADYLRRGWKLLRDMYTEDPERKQHWEDFEAFAKAQVSDPLGMAGREFPEEYLPKALVEMRKKAAVEKAKRSEFVFPTEKRAAEAPVVEPEEKPKEKPASGRKRSERAQG